LEKLSLAFSGFYENQIRAFFRAFHW
jgi:hypothetical protein